MTDQLEKVRKEVDQIVVEVDRFYEKVDKAEFAQAMAAEASIWNRNASNREAYKRLVKRRASRMYWAGVKRKVKEWWKR